MKQYLDSLRHVLEHGEDEKGDVRAVLESTNQSALTRKVFGYEMRFDLSDGTIPVVTTKPVWWKGLITEFIWYMNGGTNIKPLVDQGVNVWTKWPYQDYCSYLETYSLATLKVKYGLDKEQVPRTLKEFSQVIKDMPANSQFVKDFGALGPVYGSQFRNWTETKKVEATADTEEFGHTSFSKYMVKRYDQVKMALDTIKNKPNDRRIIISGWNVADIDKMRLPCCHGNHIQFDVTPSGKLNMATLQRSCDALLGVPWNIACYSVWLSVFADLCGLERGELVYRFNNYHIYQNHIQAVNEQLEREPYPAPRFEFTGTSIDDLSFDQFLLHDYNHHGKLEGDQEVAI